MFEEKSIEMSNPIIKFISKQTNKKQEVIDKWLKIYPLEKFKNYWHIPLEEKQIFLNKMCDHFKLIKDFNIELIEKEIKEEEQKNEIDKRLKEAEKYIYDECRFSIKKSNSKKDYRYSKILSDQDYRGKNVLNFYILSNKKLKGKIVNKINKLKVRIPLIREYTFYNKKEDTTESFICHMDSTKNISRLEKTSELYGEYYIYDFITRDKQYFLLHKEDIELSEYIVEGMSVNIDSNATLGKDFKLGQKVPLLFVNKITGNKIIFKSHKELITKSKEINLTENNWFNYLFSYKDNFENFSFRQPKWYEWMLNAFLFSTYHDTYNMHLIVIGDPDSGKTQSTAAVYNKFDEPQEFTSGSNCRIRGLIPSFNSNPIKMGALVTAIRLHFVDEFFKMLGNEDDENRKHVLGKLNSLYDGKKSLFTSGNGEAEGQCKSKVMVVTNPDYGTRDIYQIMKFLDKSFLSRNLIYYQNSEHIKMIKSGELLDKCIYEMDKYDFLGIYDYMQTFRSNYDLSLIEKIFEHYEQFLKPAYDTHDYRWEHYHNRQLHHLKCLMDGIVKTRCLFEKDCSFCANLKDYDVLQIVWQNIIVSWGEGCHYRSDRQKKLKNNPYPLQMSDNVIKKNDNLLGKGCSSHREKDKDIVKTHPTPPPPSNDRIISLLNKYGELSTDDLILGLKSNETIIVPLLERLRHIGEVYNPGGHLDKWSVLK